MAGTGWGDAFASAEPSVTELKLKRAAEPGVSRVAQHCGTR